MVNCISKSCVSAFFKKNIVSYMIHTIIIKRLNKSYIFLNNWHWNETELRIKLNVTLFTLACLWFLLLYVKYVKVLWVARLVPSIPEISWRQMLNNFNINISFAYEQTVYEISRVLKHLKSVWLKCVFSISTETNSDSVKSGLGFMWNFHYKNTKISVGYVYATSHQRNFN